MNWKGEMGIEEGIFEKNTFGACWSLQNINFGNVIELQMQFNCSAI